MSIERIGWIGTGVIGRAMCEHILNAGYTLNVYNRTKVMLFFPLLDSRKMLRQSSSDSRDYIKYWRNYLLKTLTVNNFNYK